MLRSVRLPTGNIPDLGNQNQQPTLGIKFLWPIKCRFGPSHWQLGEFPRHGPTQPQVKRKASCQVLSENLFRLQARDHVLVLDGCYDGWATMPSPQRRRIEVESLWTQHNKAASGWQGRLEVSWILRREPWIGKTADACPDKLPVLMD